MKKNNRNNPIRFVEKTNIVFVVSPTWLNKVQELLDQNHKNENIVPKHY